MPPDTVYTMLIAGSSGQAMDWPANVDIARFTGQSTAGAQMVFEVALQTTRAAAPTSGATTGSSALYGCPVIGQGSFQIPGGSTGFSVAALSSGYVSVEMWRRG